MKTITVDTVQGLGDLLWVYRKLAPLYEKINLNVLIVKDDAVQKRSGDFLKTLPQVGEVNFKTVLSETYRRVAQGFYDTNDLNGEYSINGWLEHGIHIDQIDSNPVMWDVGLKVEPVSTRANYLLLYVSGCPHNSEFHQMASDAWANLAIKAARAARADRCLLVGAPYDAAKLIEVQALIQPALPSRVITDFNISQTAALIKGAKYFVAYQSGLCMLSEELGVPTFMVYYPHNAAMVSTWIRRKHLLAGLFRNAFFGMPESMLSALAVKHIKALGIK